VEFYNIKNKDMKIGKIDLNLNSIMMIALIILTLLLFKECNSNENLKLQNAVDKQNQLALTDSVRIIKNRLGEEISVKNVLISDKKNLMDLNKDLAGELKKIEGKVLYISTEVARIKNQEPIVVNNTIKEYPNGLRELNWSYTKAYNNNDSRSLAGNSRFVVDTIGGKFTILDRGTTITKDEMKIKLTTGLTELNDSYQIFVKTDYPGVTFDKIDGAILDKKRFMKQTEPTIVWGPSVYFGLGIDPLNRTAGPQIGVGISATLNVNKYIKKLFGK